MSIFFWFLIIAVTTLTLNLIFILQMKKHKNIRIFPVCVILCTGYLFAILLYLFTSLHGTHVLEQRQAACFEIDAQSYQAVSDGAHTSFTFCSKEGIPFHFSDTELLNDEYPQTPTSVAVYYCKTRTGFSDCYLREGTAVYYLLR